MEGYDHILDIVDEEGVALTDVIAQRGDTEMGNLLASIPAFEVLLLLFILFYFTCRLVYKRSTFLKVKYSNDVNCNT